MAVIASHAGNHGDAVISGGLQHTPVIAPDFLDCHNLLGTGAFGGGVGYFIANIHILDGADDVLSPTVMTA